MLLKTIQLLPIRSVGKMTTGLNQLIVAKKILIEFERKNRERHLFDMFYEF